MAPQPIKLSNAAATGGITNTSGNPVDLVTTHDWVGYFCQSPTSPIQNGALGNFLHVSGPDNRGSQGAVVYRCHDNAGKGLCDILLAWSVMLKGNGGSGYKNQVLTQVREVGHFTPPGFDWEKTLKYVLNSGTSSEDYGYGFKSDVLITDNTPYAALVAAIQVAPAKRA